jgi:AraC family transcriptional regulator
MPSRQAPISSGFGVAATGLSACNDLTGKAAVVTGGCSGIGVEKGGGKYGMGLLVSSADRAWSGLSAELRYHSKGAIAWTAPQSDVEICVDVSGSETLVTRRATGIEDRRVASRGSIWLSPPGWQDGSVDIAEDLPRILHIYLPLSQFPPRNLGIDESGIGVLRYERAFEDSLLAEIANAIASELQAQTSAGNLLVEALASSLAARLVQSISVHRPRSFFLVSQGKGSIDAGSSACWIT